MYRFGLFRWHSWIGYFPFIWSEWCFGYCRVLFPRNYFLPQNDCSGGGFRGTKRILRGFFHHYLVPMWEEDFLLQASLMGVTVLLFWVRGTCPDRGWGRFHTLRGVKDTPAGPYVGDRGAAGLLGWIRSAEQRCRSRLGGTRGRPGEHSAAPLMVLCGSLPELRTVPWGLRGDGVKGALPPSRAASSSLFPLLPPPPPGAGAPPRQILLPRAVL